MKDVLMWRNMLLRQVKCYPAKVNVTDRTKDDFTQPLSMKEILDKLEIPSRALQYPNMKISSCI